MIRENTSIVVFVFVRINSTVQFTKSMWSARGKINSISRSKAIVSGTGGHLKIGHNSYRMIILLLYCSDNINKLCFLFMLPMREV